MKACVVVLADGGRVSCPCQHNLRQNLPLLMCIPCAATCKRQHSARKQQACAQPTEAMVAGRRQGQWL